jgi:hypothetical protein
LSRLARIKNLCCGSSKWKWLALELVDAAVSFLREGQHEFYKTQAMRLSTYGKPRVIACGEDLPHHIGLPRGASRTSARLSRAPRWRADALRLIHPVTIRFPAHQNDVP